MTKSDKNTQKITDKTVKREKADNTDKKEIKKTKEKPVFEFKAKNLPEHSGCYLFFDEKDTLIYVGKAKNIKKRVSQYFQKSKNHSPKTALMVKKIRKIKTRITESEMEALILENNLIKKNLPKFNILLRDDKNFLYLRITNDLVPKLEITRKIQRDGSFYVGPKTSSKHFRQMIKFCQKVFLVRDCKLQFEMTDEENLKVVKNPENRKLPCMDYHLKKCSGICGGEISRDLYLDNVKNMKKFLRGNTAEVLKELQEQMMNFAENKNFEAAAKTRDLMQSIEISSQKQRIELTTVTDADFIDFYRSGKQIYFVRLVFRNGKLIDQNEVTFSSPLDAQNSEILEKFVIQFYEKVDKIPAEIYLPEKLENTEKILEFLQKIEVTKIEFVIPQKGDKKKVLEIAQKNAVNFAKKTEISLMSQAENFAKALPKLAQVLNLKTNLSRIECYDVSHYSGDFPVASQVVFKDGKPKNSDYRRYHVKTLPAKKIDDYAAMNEVLGRRFTQLLSKLKKDEIPDLIVLDGGKGQISAVMKLFKNGDLTAPENFDPEAQIISLAKREEQIFRPNQKEPIELDFSNPALKLLQQVRDEAHRFAISFNKSLRKKNQHKSILDEISGIGGVTKKKLMKEFETVANIRNAEDEDLLKIINKKQLESLRKML